MKNVFYKCVLEFNLATINGPTFGNFGTIRTEGSMQDITVTTYKTAASPLLPLLNVMYCVRVSLWQSKYSLSNTTLYISGENQVVKIVVP